MRAGAFAAAIAFGLLLLASGNARSDSSCDCTKGAPVAAPVEALLARATNLPAALQGLSPYARQRTAVAPMPNARVVSAWSASAFARPAKHSAGKPALTPSQTTLTAVCAATQQHMRVRQELLFGLLRLLSPRGRLPAHHAAGLCVPGGQSNDLSNRRTPACLRQS
jgi:hypothetical protein